MAYYRTPCILFVAVLLCFSSSAQENATTSTRELPTVEETTVSTPVAATPIAAEMPAANLSNLCSTSTNLVQEGKEFLDTFFSQVFVSLKHFRNPKAIGVSGQTVLEDPLVMVRNSEANLGGFMSGDFYDVTIHGLSNFTVEAVNIDFDGLKFYMMIKIENVLILGNCTTYTFIGWSGRGPFNATLTNVTGEGIVSLTVNPDGRLVANRLRSNVAYENLTVYATWLMATPLIGLDKVILAALKPDILGQIDERITQKVNSILENVSRMPCGGRLSPVDVAVLEGREFVRRHYEPLDIEKTFEYDSVLLAARLGPVRVHGLSRFARVGKATTSMVNRTVQFRIKIVTGRLLGRCEYSDDFGNGARHGVANFTVEHVQFEVKLNQSIDVCKRSVLDDLQLEVGRIAVSLNGGATLVDNLVELAAQYLPSMLKHVIIEPLERLIKEYIQTAILDRVGMNEVSQSHFPFLEPLCDD